MEKETVVVVKPLKSGVIGFLLALFLGWLGIDRFYKGNILLGIIKLIGGLFVSMGAFFYLSVAFGGAYFGIYVGDYLRIITLVCAAWVVWHILDLILVPLGIYFDNKKN